MIRIVLLFLSIFVISCSSIQFKSSEIIPVTFNVNENHNDEVSIEVNKAFYLWGILPLNQNVNIDEEFARQGYQSISSLEINEFAENKKALWMMFTLGLYYPQRYKLEGKYKI